MMASNQPRWKPFQYCFLAFIGFPAAIGLTAVYLSLTNYHERATRRMEYDALVKQQMIQHGYSAQEIEAVLKASSDDENRNVNFHNDAMRNQLIRDLRKQGMKAEDIERVVRAAYPAPSDQPARPMPPRTMTVAAPRPPVEPSEPPPPPEPRPAMPFERD